MDEHYSTILIIICTLVASAFFSGMEIAFVSANRLKIELDKKKGTITGKISAFFVKNDSNFIASMLLGNNVALVIYGIQMAKLMEEPLSKIVPSSTVLLCQTILSTLLILVTAEFLPKAIFQINPNRILKLGSIPLWLMYYIMYIPTQFTMLISNAILRLFKIDTKNSEGAFTKVDLDDYVRDLNARMADEADLGNEMQILQNALDFSNVKARDCMIPRTELSAIDVDEDIEVLKKKFIDTGYSKILIFRESIDNIIGYAHSFELFKNPSKIYDILIPIEFVPEAIPGKLLLEKFNKQQGNIAVVVDEFGGTSGLVTIEDVIEEIFGEIEDEHDTDNFIDEKLSENKYRFSARLDIDYINEQYELQLPEASEYETLGGLVLNHLAAIPEENTVLQLEKHKIIIEQVSDRRIDVIIVELID